MSDDIKVTNFNDAQLFWDGQDPKNAGWVLRWRDERGAQCHEEIGEDEDASIETLAYQAAACAPDEATGTIDVFRGDQKSGRVRLEDGGITDWRVL